MLAIARRLKMGIRRDFWSAGMSGECQSKATRRIPRVCRHEGIPHAEILAKRSGGEQGIHCNSPLRSSVHKPIIDANVARSGTTRSGSP